MSAARSSWLVIMSSYQRRRTAARSLAVLAAQAGNALLAASMARRVSVAPMSGIVPSRSPVAGLTTSRVPPPSACVQAPSTYACWRNSLGSCNLSITRSPRFLPSGILPRGLGAILTGQPPRQKIECALAGESGRGSVIARPLIAVEAVSHPIVNVEDALRMRRLQAVDLGERDALVG